MASDHDMLWRRCAHLGRVLLPLVDQEPCRHTRRHENLRTWGIDIAEGERLIEVFAALTAHAVAADTAVSTAEFDALPLTPWPTRRLASATSNCPPGSRAPSPTTVTDRPSTAWVARVGPVKGRLRGAVSARVAPAPNPPLGPVRAVDDLRGRAADSGRVIGGAFGCTGPARAALVTVRRERFGKRAARCSGQFADTELLHEQQAVGVGPVLGEHAVLDQ